MVLFYSYVSLPEGILNSSKFHALHAPWRFLFPSARLRSPVTQIAIEAMAIEFDELPIKHGDVIVVWVYRIYRRVIIFPSYPLISWYIPWHPNAFIPNLDTTCFGLNPPALLHPVNIVTLSTAIPRWVKSVSIPCQLLEPHVLHLGFRLSISQICVKAPDRTNGVYKVRMLSIELLNCWTCWFLTRCVISSSFQSNPHHDPVFLSEITVLLVNSSCPCFDWDSPCSTAQYVGVRKTTDMGPRHWFEGKFTGKPHDLHGKINGFSVINKCSLKPIHWTIFHHF